MENKTSKYFKYAIGEIVLVVIGILIALQINNWNETRLKGKKLNTIYLEVQRELAFNIKEISKVIDYYEKKDSISYLILNDKLTRQDYIDNPESAYFLAGFSTTDFIDKGYTNLNANKDLVPKEFNSVLEKLNILYEGRVSIMRETNSEFMNFMHNYSSQLSYTKPWYVDYSYKGNHKNEAFLNYVTDDPIFKNQVYEYYVYFSNLFLNEIKSKSIIAYKAMAEITGEKGDLDNSIYFQTTEDLKKFAGKYKINEIDDNYNPDLKRDVIEFSAKNNQLFTTFSGREYKIHPHAENVFIFNDKDTAKITFLSNKDNEISGIRLFNQSYYTNWTKIND